MAKKKKIRPAGVPAKKADADSAPAAVRESKPASRENERDLTTKLLDFRRDLLEMPERTWNRWAYGIVALAGFLRFFDILNRPVHHDEGVNGWFLTNLIRDNMYKYDPANYHGPSL